MAEMSDMSFWALTVPPGGKPCKYEVEQTAEISSYVHITNVAIPHNGKDGPHCLTITLAENEFTIATLDKATHPQHGLDFVIDQTIVFRNYGTGPIHLLGYNTIADVSDLQGPGGEDGSDEDEEDSDYSGSEEGEESDDDEEEAPPLVSVKANGKPNGVVKAAATPAKAKAATPSKLKAPPPEESDEDEDEDEGEDEDEDDEGDEDEDGMGLPMHLNPNDLVMEYSSDLDEGDEGEDDEGEDDEGEDDEDEEEGEEEEEDSPPPAKVSGKRPVPQQQVPVTPAAKKSKAMDGSAVAQAPKSAPPKVQQQPAAAGTPGQKAGPGPVAKPANEKEYEAALVALLKSKPNKTAALPLLGTAVVRPQGVPKLGAYFKSKPELFKLDKTGNNVTLV